MIKKYSKALKLIFKILFSGGAIYYILSKLDLTQVGETIKDVNPLYLIAAIIVYITSILGSTFRLNSLFRTLPLHIDTWPNIKLYWLGLFYNFFLPGGVGGDGYKVYYLKKHFNTPVKKLLGAIFADRLSGLSIILIYLLGLVYYIDYELPYQGWFFILIPFVSAGYYLFLWLFNKNLTKAFWSVSLWSLVCQGVQTIAVILILKSMGAEVNEYWNEYIFLFFLSTIASAVPVTLGGIGAREMVFYTGAVYLGINEAQAVATSFLFYLIALVSSFPGLYFVFKTNHIFSEFGGKEIDIPEFNEEEIAVEEANN